MKLFLYLLFTAALTLGLSACGSDEESEGVAYPEDKVIDDTNLDGGELLEISTEYESIEKKILIASLIRQKNDLEYRIREIKRQSGDSNPPTGDLSQLKTYVDNISQEITKVRQTPDARLVEVEETAMAAIEGAGALLQSSYMRIDGGW